MPLKQSFLSALYVSTFLGGCSLFLPDEGHRDPVPLAKSYATTNCQGQLAERPELYRFDVVDTVSPNYVTVSSNKGGRDVRMLGAKLHLRPIPGLTPAAVERALQCHSAARVLGKGMDVPSDPYFLPSGWVDITVSPDKDGNLVTVQAVTPEQGQRVLARARTFRAGVRTEN